MPRFVPSFLALTGNGFLDWIPDKCTRLVATDELLLAQGAVEVPRGAVVARRGATRKSTPSDEIEIAYESPVRIARSASTRSPAEDDTCSPNVQRSRSQARSERSSPSPMPIGCTLATCNRGMSSSHQNLQEEPLKSRINLLPGESPSGSYRTCHRSFAPGRNIGLTHVKK